MNLMRFMAAIIFAGVCVFVGSGKASAQYCALLLSGQPIMAA